MKGREGGRGRKGNRGNRDDDGKGRREKRRLEEWKYG